MKSRPCRVVLKDVTSCSTTKREKEPLALLKSTSWAVVHWPLLHLKHFWEPSCYCFLEGISDISVLSWAKSKLLNQQVSIFLFRPDASHQFLLTPITNFLFISLWWSRAEQTGAAFLQLLQIKFSWIPFSLMKEDEPCNTCVVTACQVLLTAQPSWRLEGAKPFTRESDFSGHCGLIEVLLITEELLPRCQWRLDQDLIHEREESFTIFVFLAKTGTVSLKAMPTARQAACSWNSVIPRCDYLCLLPPS